MDPLSIVVDEVALEGLDGITIFSLWIRLEDHKPTFPLKLDECTKEFLWRSLLSNDDLKFYELPQERDDVELFDRYKDIDPETGIETTSAFSASKTDIYPVHIIVENKDGIQGSCAAFVERKDITKLLRTKTLAPLLNLQEALGRYGRKLVVVASQALRFRTLIGSESDPDLKLSDDSFCLLERVGRSRWQGELQRDLHGQSFKTDARKLHYIRKSLVKHGLIRMQSHVTRLNSGQQQQQHSILLQLKRFHILRRSKYDILMENVSNILQQLPDQFATLVVLKDHLNLSECSFKRLLNYMRSAKLIQLCQYPLEDLDPAAGPCTNKNGSKVRVRCVRLLKQYAGKGGADDDDDDDDDDENDAQGRTAFPSEGRIMEKDVLSQAYDLIVSCGTKGIPRTGISFRMNIGKLESRMICRTLEREGLIKGFMEDEGRQRTTKFISHKCVGVSDQFQLFAKEQERSKLLSSSTALGPDFVPATPKLPLTLKSRGKNKASEQGRNSDKTSECSESTTSVTPDPLLVHAAVEKAPDVEAEPSKNYSASSLPPSKELSEVDTSADSNTVVKDVEELQIPSVLKPKDSSKKSHETYRLLKRKNLIVEAVNNYKIIEGLFQIQKMVNDEEKLDGISSKCCRKTILRLVNCLRKEGLLKIFTTTVVVDGITKKVEMVAHPSVQRNDDIVNRIIDQVRFRISSSYSAIRLQAEENAREKTQESNESSSSMTKSQKSKEAEQRKTKVKEDDEFKPTMVKGLGKSFGFQPKMFRLRVVHTFLYYLIYNHPLKDKWAHSDSTSETPPEVQGSCAEAKRPEDHGKQNQKDTELNEKAASGSVEQETAASLPALDGASGHEEEKQMQKRTPGNSDIKLTVSADAEESWKKFIPPVRIHKEYGSGWVMVGDVVLCLPLSVFVQVIQINYKVDGLEDYLNDPVKQHYLVSALPTKMRRQLLYKRRYIFSFYENLQKLVYMGLLQFGPVEKFKEKDQVFVFLKRKASIVDTTNAEPHYWLVSESPEKPFERRQYTFSSSEEIENYWFDLMCVCLNTPLGVIRNRRNATEEEDAPSFVQERNVFVGLAYLLKGSCEVCDDGSIPGDGKGAGGLHSEFFAHLKRNWWWTNHLLSQKRKPTGSEALDTKIRLKSLLTKNALRIALTAGGTTTPRGVTPKQPLMAEVVEVGIEPASRNKQVVGGKRQKRKRNKKEVVKVQRKKKKEPKKRTPAHDEADHKALKMMTRQRVYWSVQEDSLVMLCCVASDLLNSKLKRPFVPYCAVRDLLHAEFEMSVDKTSLAVGRRSRYILKNPQTRVNYRICLAEVYQDKPLMKVLEEMKPADPNKAEDCAEVFSEYVKLLRVKFSSVTTAHNIIIPDTKEELFSRFKVSAIDSKKQISRKDTVNCRDDIHAIVLHNLIQSTLAMTNNQMKSSRSFQTFHVYSKYSQETLCQVFIKCKKSGLVNRRRVCPPFGPKKNRALPILPMSYQLSQSYYKCFTWRLPNSLCTDSFQFLRNLINKGTRDDRPATTFYHETENRSLNGEMVVLGRKGVLKALEQSRSKVYKRSESESEKTNTTTANESEMEGDETLTAGSDDGQTKSHSSREQPAETEPAALPGPQDPPDAQDMLHFSMNSPGGACVVSLSLMSLGLLSLYVSIPKQMVVVDSNLVEKDVAKSGGEILEEEDDDDFEGGECEGRKKFEVKAHQASHTKYLMMRGYCCPGIVKMRNLNTSDNMVVESCVIRMQLRNTPAHDLFSMDSSLPLDLTKCGPSLLPSILTYCVNSFFSPPSVEECERHLTERRGYTPQDLESCAQLRISLDQTGENGLDMSDLYEAHSHLREKQSGCSRNLKEYLKDLQEEGQIIKVGSLGERWVLIQHAEPWLLTLNSKQRAQSRISSDGPFLNEQHHIPFMRKRCWQDVREETEEPPSKKLALDKQESKDGEDLDRLVRDEPSETPEAEAPEKQADEGMGDTAMVVEVENGTQAQSKEKEVTSRQEEVESVEIPEGRMQLRSRKEPRTGSAVQDDEENVSFISRPWRMVDGKLNRQVCKGMLEAVLYHIMSRPGLTQQALVEHYRDVLQPMAALDLVQALVDLGCVTKKIVVKGSKPSLFSRPANQTRCETGEETEEPDAVFYEPTISCCLRLSQLLPNERHWNYCVP